MQAYSLPINCASYLGRCPRLLYFRALPWKTEFCNYLPRGSIYYLDSTQASLTPLGSPQPGRSFYFSTTKFDSSEDFKDLANRIEEIILCQNPLFPRSEKIERAAQKYAALLDMEWDTLGSHRLNES